MKMTRKIIPAIVMLLVSAIMLSTASFAWFASSTTVEATSMSVKAQSAAKFIQISNTSGSGFSNSAAAQYTDKALDLVHAKVTDKSSFTWHVGNSTDPDATGTTNFNTSYDLTVEDGVGKANVDNDPELEPLVLVNTFYVKMSDGSTSTLTKLTVDTITVSGTGDNLNKALRVLVKGANGVQLYANTTGSNSGTMTKVADSSADFFIDEVTTAEKSFQVYVYYDGADDVSTTNNALTLNGLSVSIKFTASEGNPITPNT